MTSDARPFRFTHRGCPGHEFLDGGWSLREPGSVSSFATADWVPTQLLPQLVMARTEDWFGLAGVAWLSELQFLALALTFYVVARRWSDPIVASPLVLVALDKVLFETVLVLPAAEVVVGQPDTVLHRLH